MFYLRAEEMDDELQEGAEGNKRNKSKSKRRSKQMAMEQLDGALILEFSPKGTIKSISDEFGKDFDARKNFFDTKCNAQILAQISNGVAFLHNNRIVHRDLSVSNIFVTNADPFTVKIGDFGQSFMFTEGGRLPERCGGTAGFYPRYKITFKL